MTRSTQARNHLAPVAIAGVTALVFIANLAMAQGPAAVNYNSIQSANGRPLFSYTPGNAETPGGGSLLRFHNGRLAQRFTPQRGRMIDAQLSVQRAEEAAGTHQPVQATPTSSAAALQNEIRGVLQEQAPVVREEIPTPMPPSPDGQIRYEGNLDCDCPECSGTACTSGTCSPGGKCLTGKCGGKGGDGTWCDWTGWSWVCICVPLPPSENLTLTTGVHGFKNQLNGGLDSSFGFQEGINLGAPMPLLHWWGVGWQIGVQGVHSNFNGAGSNGFAGVPAGAQPFTTDERNQTFFTWGMFRRVDWGLQAGFAIDHLDEDYYYNINLTQFRGELSWVYPNCHELGVFFHSSSSSDTSTTTADTAIGADGTNFGATTTDLVAAFWRVRFGDCDSSHARVYLGGTSDRDLLQAGSGSSFLIGADTHLCLGPNFAVAPGFTYATAPGSGVNSALHETWNIGINLVWSPRGHTCGTERSYYRPLFNVADNGSMLVDFNR